MLTTSMLAYQKLTCPIRRVSGKQWCFLLMPISRSLSSVVRRGNPLAYQQAHLTRHQVSRSRLPMSSQDLVAFSALVPIDQVSCGRPASLRSRVTKRYPSLLHATLAKANLPTQTFLRPQLSIWRLWRESRPSHPRHITIAHIPFPGSRLPPKEANSQPVSYPPSKPHRKASMGTVIVRWRTLHLQA
jgi:hypothetical protein